MEWPALKQQLVRMPRAPHDGEEDAAVALEGLVRVRRLGVGQGREWAQTRVQVDCRAGIKMWRAEGEEEGPGERARVGFVGQGAGATWLGLTDGRILEVVADAGLLDELEAIVRQPLLEEQGGDKLLAAKGSAFEVLADLVREDTELVLREQARLARLVREPGNLMHVNPLASPNKLMEGFLKVQSAGELPGSVHYAEKYVCVAPGKLYIFDSTQDESPSTYIPLHNVHVARVRSEEARGGFVLELQTPAMAVALRAKHHAARDAWLRAIRRAAQVLAPSDDQRFRFAQQGPFDALDDVLNDEFARGHFREFLAATRNDNALEFYVRTILHKRLCEREQRKAAAAAQAHSIAAAAAAVEAAAAAETKAADSSGSSTSHDHEGDEIDEEDEEEEEEEDHGTKMSPEEAEAAGNMQESAWDLIGDFVEPDGDHYLPALEGKYEEVEEAVQEGHYGTCLDACLSLAKEHLESLMPAFQVSEPGLALQALRAAPESGAETLFGDKVLVVQRLGDPDDTTHYSLKLGDTTIGRDPSNDLVLHDARVSRRHCTVRIDELDHCLIFDVGSSRGTQVNGKPVIERGLRAGDVIEVGSFQLRLRLER